LGKKKKIDMREVYRSIYPENAQKFLDIGCANGKESFHLVEQGKEVVGVEIIPEEAAVARTRLSKVIIGEADNIELDYPEGYFDCILYGGIIGAFNNTFDVLKRHSYYLKEGGYIVANVPNIRYYKVISMLLFKGVWDYMPDGGILCDYYLRYFTWKNYEELFDKLGYRIEIVKRNVRGSSFAKFMNKVTFNTFLELLTYEFYLRAVKVTKEDKNPSLETREKSHF